ncbi:aldo/keto reductase [Pyruvatibacter sp.]|uniref:aldo/keto reductase n=1 Tax=Pyruvatibacter sp. TaxID=1981328 RepID=UPI0032EF3ACD
MTDIPRRPFGKTGLEVSCLGFGGAPIGLLETDEGVSSQLLNGLLDRGVNVFDTATMYYGSQAMIGQCISHRRDEFVIVTKCGLAGEADNPDRWTPEKITQDIDNSLKELRTDVVDVMLLHTPSESILKQGDALGAVVKAREAGKVRHAGFSGDNELATWAAAQPDIEVIQTSINMCDQVNIEGLLPAAREHGVGIMVKRPIANAAWKSQDEQYERYRNYYSSYHDRFAKMGLSIDDVSAAAGETLTWPEAALRFTLSHDGVSTAIIGTTKPGHIDQNAAAAAKGPLPERAVALIRNAFSRARGGDDWPGLT